MGLYMLLDAPLSSLTLVSPRLALSAAPAAFCWALDLAGMVEPPHELRANSTCACPSCSLFGILGLVFTDNPVSKSPQRREDNHRKNRHGAGDEVVAERNAHTDRAREPHARAGRQTLHAAPLLEDCAGAKKGNARGDGLDRADGIGVFAAVLQRVMENLERQRREQRRGDGNQHVRPQPGRDAVRLAFVADDAAE